MSLRVLQITGFRAAIVALAVVVCLAAATFGQVLQTNPVPAATPPVNPSGSPQTSVGSVGTPAAPLPNDPPPVAPDFRAPERPMPSAERIGVDQVNQLSLSLDEAIESALKNSNDIDAS